MHGMGRVLGMSRATGSVSLVSWLGVLAAGCGQSAGVEEGDSSSETGTSGALDLPPQECGNGLVDPGEACDDGNALDGDGCSSTCTTESWSEVDVFAGWACTCVVFTDGRLRCWGRGGYHGWGEYPFAIGDDETPASVGDVPGGTDVARVDAGYMQVCAVMRSGELRCWGGYEEFGQTGGAAAALGMSDTTPMDVGGPAEVAAIGNFHSCALLADGGVRCWGKNDRGQLGYGHTANLGDDEPPSAAGDVPLGGTVVELGAGAQHTCARLGDGAVRCWGAGIEDPLAGGARGMLGQGNIDDVGDDELPEDVPPVPLGGPAIRLAVAGNHACAVLEGGTLRCWGDGGGGQLGYGNTDDIGDDEVPTDIEPVDVGEPVFDVITGTVTCVQLAEGRVKCWGAGSARGYGNADLGDDEIPADLPYVDVGAPVVRLSGGQGHVCARLPVGGLRCWGANSDGQLGYGRPCVGEQPPGGTACDKDPWCCIGDDETPAQAGPVPFE
jgi:cysteine-rich repeat protein